MPEPRVAVVGASGYAGAIAAAILHRHPGFELAHVTARSDSGRRLDELHPRSRVPLELETFDAGVHGSVDAALVAYPHGAAAPVVAELRERGVRVVDLSADFRLRDPGDYPKWYGDDHQDPELLQSFVYGIPELHRQEIRSADLISSAGCMAATSILGLYPLFQARVVDLTRPVVVEAKTGSSGSGGGPGLGSHHPERSGAMRSFKPTGHRHSAEIVQELTVDGKGPEVAFSATAIEAVRGILATSHVFLTDPLPEKEIWAIYRAAYKDEPFMRLVKEASGVHRYPEPKLLSGTNWCDVGFERDPTSNRVVVMAALDNLMKGAAGQAVQAFNIRCGFPETTALEFTGLHPI